MLEFSSLIASAGLVQGPPNVEDPIIMDMLCSAMAAVRTPKDALEAEGSGATASMSVEGFGAPNEQVVGSLQSTGGGAHLLQQVSIRRISLGLMQVIGLCEARSTVAELD